MQGPVEILSPLKSSSVSFCYGELRKLNDTESYFFNITKNMSLVFKLIAKIIHHGIPIKE